MLLFPSDTNNSKQVFRNVCNGHASLLQCLRQIMGLDSAVGIETRYRLDGPGIQSRWG